ncbi:carbohydrate-binding domain-containing protein [Chloroflexota bacterium]
MNKLIALLVFILILPLTACSIGTDEKDVSPVSWSSYFDPEISYITLEGDSITLDGDGVIVDGNQLAITSAGIYSISGTLNDGQIIVKTDDQETVNLILKGVDITCSTSSAIYIKNADKTVITLADGTENFVTDSDSYIVEGSVIEDSESIEPNAAIFSKDDLIINGSGSLTLSTEPSIELWLSISALIDQDLVVICYSIS